MSTATSEPGATPQPPEVPEGHLAYVFWWWIHGNEEQFHRLLMLIYPLYLLLALIVAVVLVRLLSNGPVVRWMALVGCGTVFTTGSVLLSRVRKWGRRRKNKKHQTTDGSQKQE